MLMDSTTILDVAFPKGWMLLCRFRLPCLRRLRFGIQADFVSDKIPQQVIAAHISDVYTQCIMLVITLAKKVIVKRY